MKKILIPTDFSECADNALEYAIALAKKFDSELILLSSYRIPSAGSTSIVVNLERELMKETEKDLKELVEKKQLKYPFLKIKTYSDYNSPINSILRFIDKLDIDLIVMGTTGASGVKEILLGSTTSSVISKVNIPTFVIPEYSNINQANEMIISADLLGLENNKPMKFAQKIAYQLDLSVEVLNVYSEENSSIELQLDKKRERLQSVFENKKITFKLIKSDNVEESILNNVKENSILAVVSRSRGFFENLFHSSMSKRLTMHSKNPILVLHE